MSIKISINNNLITLYTGKYIWTDFQKLNIDGKKIDKIIVDKDILVIIHNSSKNLFYDYNKFIHDKCFNISICLSEDIIIIVKNIYPFDKCSKKSKGTSCEILGDPCSIKWDYIIVGYGTASGPLARYLTDPDNTGCYHNKVLMIEYGENRTMDPKVTDATGAFTNDLTNDPEYAFAYPIKKNVPPILNYSNGRMWGGSSSHNGLQAVRGAPDTWDQIALVSGNPIWSYNNVLPYMLFMENYHPNGTIGNLSQRGSNGLLNITQQASTNSSPFNQQYAITMSAPLVSDYNDPTTGVLVTSVNQQFATPPPNYYRSASYSFLPPSVLSEDGYGVDGRKLRVISNGLVAKVLFSGTTAIGIEYVHSDNKEKVFHVYGKKIILSAGTEGTPAILQRSGVGPSALLNSLNIPVIIDNPNVGKNLQNHYGALAVIENPSGNPALPLFTQSFVDLSPYLPANPNLRRFQILITDALGALFFNSSFPGILPALGVNVFSPTYAGLFSINVSAKSLGSIEIVTKDPSIYPLQTYNLYTDGSVTDIDSDANRVVAFYKLAKDVATAYGTNVVYPYPTQYTDDNTLLDAAKTAAFIAYHNVGTCRMAETAASGVVDGKMNVFGAKNLMICDSSIAPLINTGNTAYPAYIFGIILAKQLGAYGLP